MKRNLYPEDNQYYKFEDGMIVKFDKSNVKFYFLNEDKKWQERSSL